MCVCVFVCVCLGVSVDLCSIITNIFLGVLCTVSVCKVSKASMPRVGSTGNRGAPCRLLGQWGESNNDRDHYQICLLLNSLCQY